MAVKNISASLLARLKNQAKSEGISFQAALQLFCQEEFLRRLSTSEYVDNFILKGGMFIYTLTGFDSRVTRDIDFLMCKLSNDLSQMETVMQNICSAPSENSFILMKILGSEQITPEKKYPGVKIKFLCNIDNVRVPFSIDIGIDDIIIPQAEKRKITTILPDFSAPEVYTYSVESTVAEKLDAILQRMDATSRMKDFYDIYYLSGIFDFDGTVLFNAVKATLSHRKRELNPEAFEKIAQFAESPFMLTQWKAFEPAKNAELSFITALDRIDLFLKPVYECVLNNISFDKKWSCKGLEWD